MATATKPILNIEDGQKVQHVTGVYDKEITSKDLKKHPEKYIDLYPTLYENARQVAHEVNTRAKVTKTGKKNVLKESTAENGVKYTVLRGKNDKSIRNK